MLQDYASENEASQRPMRPSIELPPIKNHLNQQSIPPFHSPRPRELLPSMMANSPPGRSSTLPPLQRRDSTQRKEKTNRPRKSSITQSSRKPKHERTKSKDYSRRLSIEGRKAFSAEPPGAAAAAAMGKRWEDLIDAATSATEADSDRDMTPVRSSAQLKMSIFSAHSHCNRYHSLLLQSNALRCRHIPACPTTANRTKLRRSTEPSHHHHHIPSPVPRYFPRSRHLWTPPSRPNHLAAISTYLLQACQIHPILHPRPSTVSRYKYTVQVVEG